MPRKKAKAQKTTKSKSGKVTQTVNVYVSKRGGGAKRPSAPRPPQPSMSDILAVIDRRQGHAFEPLVKPAAPIVPTLDPRLDALLSRIDSEKEKESKVPKPMFGSSSTTSSELDELYGTIGGRRQGRDQGEVLNRSAPIFPMPPPGSASAASSEIPMPFLSVPRPVEEAPITRVPGSGKQEAVPDSGNEFNMARVLKYDRERLDKLTRASQSLSASEVRQLQQTAIKARNAWLKTNNLQEFGRASPENVSNFKI